MKNPMDMEFLSSGSTSASHDFTPVFEDAAKTKYANKDMKTAVEDALNSYRFNSTMKDFLMTECKKYGLFNAEGEPIPAALDNCPPVVLLWWDRYKSICEHSKYLENALNIMNAAYNTKANTDSEQIMCDIIYRKFFAANKRTTLQIQEDLAAAGQPISLSSYYRLLNKGLDIMTTILVDPDQNWNVIINKSGKPREER